MPAAVPRWRAASCDAGTDPSSEPAETVIGPDGGTVVFENLSVTIPPGALGEEVEITVERIEAATATPAEGLTLMEGAAFDLGPDGLTFDEPFELAISYDLADIADGTFDEELKIYSVDVRPSALPSDVDAEAGVVVAESDHFSGYAVGRADCSVWVSLLGTRVTAEEAAPLFRTDSARAMVPGVFSYVGNEVEGTGNSSFGFGTAPDAPQPNDIGQTSGQSTYPVLVQGAQPLGNTAITYTTFLGPTADSTHLPPLEANITQNDGESLAGTVSGLVRLWDDAESDSPIQAGFRITANPLISDAVQKRCAVENNL